MAAPVLNTTLKHLIANVTEDAGAPAGAVGTLVSSMTGQAGIAISAVDAAYGAWWYSLDNGASWSAVGTPSAAAALLLAADSSTRLYFQPQADFNGSLASALTFRAWDRSAGVNGGHADTTINGGSTAFSALSDTAAITVAAVNDAPVVSASANVAATEDAVRSLGGTVSVSDDAGSAPVTVTLSVAHGTLDVNTNVAGGVDAAHVGGDTTGLVTLTGTTAQINATLGDANGLSYQGHLNYSGADVLTVQANDMGNGTGSGALTASATTSIAVAAAAPANTLASTVTTTLAQGGDVDGDGVIDAGDTVLVTVAITNNSATTAATDVALNMVLNGMTETGAVNVSPIANSDSYTVVGNTVLNAGVAGNGSPALNVGGGVFGNDREFNDSYTMSKVQGAAFVDGATVATAHGQVTMHADGTFSYKASTGYTGADSFSYTITDDGLDNVAGNADDLSTTATVSLNVTGRVWYVNGNAATNGDGSSDNPFNTLASLNSVGDVDASGDTIYLMGTTTGALSLEANQHLAGTGSALVVAGMTLANAGARSTLTSSGTTLTLASGNEIDGIRIAGSGTGISGTGFGTLTVNNAVIDTTGSALVLTNGTVAGSGFVSTDSDGGTNNISLNAVNGTLNLGSGALSGATSSSVVINGGSASIDYNGTVSHTGNAIAINVSNKTGGTVDFDGAVSASGASDGVSLANNTGATINFDGGLTLNTSASNSTAFSATGGGTVSVTGASNTITSGAGTALNVQNTNIGAADLTFQSISSNGAAVAIRLDTTGSAGNLNVTGDAASANNGSGGTIANSTDTGIYLKSTSDVSLNRMNISGSANDGIWGSNVNNLTLNRLNITNNGNGQFDAGVQLGDAYPDRLANGATGTVTVTNTVITGSAEDGFNSYNTSGTTTFNITGSTFSNNSTANGNDGLRIEAYGTSEVFANVNNNTFAANRGDHFQAVAGVYNGVSGDIHVNLTSNTLSGGNANALGQGITIGGGGGLPNSGNALFNGRVDYNISNNSINGAIGTAITVHQSSSDTNAIVNGTIAGNTIGTLGVNNSGSTQSSGIYVGSSGAGTHTVLVNNNVIREVATQGISVASTDGYATTNLTIQNNTVIVDADSLSGMEAIYVNSGATSNNIFGLPDGSTLRLDINNNTLASGDGTPNEIRIRQRFDTRVELEGYVGAPGDATAIQAYLQGRNITTDALVNPGVANAGANADGIFGIVTNVPLPAAFSTVAPEAPAAESAAPVVPDPAAESAPVDTVAAAPLAGSLLTQPVLEQFVQAAIGRWADAGASAEQLAQMHAVQFSVADLAALRLGVAQDGAVAIDRDAAGYQWFIDATPNEDSEFLPTVSATRLAADGAQVAAGTIDLLTVVMHELGHQIGLEDSYEFDAAGTLMSGYLLAGERRLPGNHLAATASGVHLAGEALLAAPLNTGTIAPGQTVVVQIQATVDAQAAGLVVNPSNSGTVTSTNLAGVATPTSVATIDTLTLGDRIFRDGNLNGVFDGAESGIDNVAINLLIDNGTVAGVFDDGDTVIATTTSSNGGRYSFSGLAAGNYIVQLTEANFSQGGVLYQLASMPGVSDPDIGIDNDDNGIVVAGKGVVSRAITLAHDTETTADASGKFDINNTLDFGFRNDAPVISNLAGDQVPFLEGASPVRIDNGADVNVSDANNANLGGGFLNVSVSANKVASEDVLGFATGSVTLSAGMAPGSVVSVNGTAIGTIVSGGVAGQDLVVAFDSGAAPFRVATLVGAVTYSNANSIAPTESVRTITVTVDDGMGGASSSTATSTVSVLGANDAPVLDLDSGAPGTGASVSYTEGAAPVRIAQAATIADADSADFAGGSLTVAFSANGSAADQLQVRNVGTAAGQIGVAGADISYGNVVIGSFSGGSNGAPLVISLTGAAATPAAVQQLVREITFSNGSAAPSTAARSIDFTLVDGDGVQNGGLDTGLAQALVSVSAVNDLPTGSVTIAGTAAQGATLTASNTLADGDGLGTISYQWQANGADIAGATASTLVLAQAQVGQAITVIARYTDAGGAAEAVTSAATANVADVNDLPTGAVTISGTAAQGETLTAANTLLDADGMGTVSYQWKANGAAIGGATGATLLLTQAQVGQAITVTASYTDGAGTAESATSSASGLVANVNDVPTGAVAISGTATQGQTLTASNTLADADGMGTVSYQWQANGSNIAGATGSTLVLAQAQVGAAISVVASYLDAGGTAESKASGVTANVANINDLPTGGVTISGVAAQGRTLSAANTLADADGMGTVSYQWQADGADISGATGATLVLGQTNVGQVITVVARYLDAGGSAETVTSSATVAVADINDVPTGSVTITGNAVQGATLSAANTLADADGMGTVSYQWQADGSDIAGATASTLALTQAQVGKAITVLARYVDNSGVAEEVASGASAAVANVNDAPTGGVAVSGSAIQGQVLTASNSLLDADGLGTISYQWQADGSDIAGATASTLALGEAQVGKAISVVARYTDNGGAAEQVASSASAPVANVNDAPTGAVTISGSAAQGQTLAASNTLLDADGMGTVSYQWQADGSDIAGATGATLVLGQSEVGKAITVVARYVDNRGAAEQAASGATARVANVNDAPTGAVTIGGSAVQGQVLAAVHALADVDGLGALAYQWRADGADIAGATAATLALTQAQVGKAISVVVRYTDGFGQAEAVASAASAHVANVNDAPTGSVSIAGAAITGESLIASNNLADADGMGQVGYQWQADGSDIAGASGDTLVLTQALEGKAITVVASYTDLGATLESKVSAATGPVAAPTVQTVDGVIVTVGTTTNSDGSTSSTVVIPVVEASRQDQVGATTVADIPLVKSAGGEALLLAQLPTGYGLQVSGSAPADNATSQTALAREIAAHADSGSQGGIGAGATAFLQGLAQSAPVLVQTVTPTAAAGGAAPATALTLTGTPDAPGNPVSALVIDARSLGGATIQLENVEFAAVMGAARINGGAGSQNIWGDSAQQQIVSGALADVVHGGGGNDIISSSAGDDQIFGDDGDDLMAGGAGDDLIDGGSGHDTVQLGGSGRADFAFQVVDGKLVVTERGNAAGGVDAVTSVETLRFAGLQDTSAQGTLDRLVATVSTQPLDQYIKDNLLAQHANGVSLHDIAQQVLSTQSQQLDQGLGNGAFVDRMYELAFGRQADSGGHDYWTGMLDSGNVDRAALVLSFTESQEKLAAPVEIDFNYTDVATLVRMYTALFDRRPDQAGINYWIGHSENGLSMHDIANNFVVSAEGQSLYGALDNQHFVAALYFDALGRQGSEAEVASWVAKLNAGAADKGDVLLGIANSAEMITLIGPIDTSIPTV